jgi:hypothetical protein
MSVEELAKTMLELFLAEMVLCTDRFDEPDVEFWSDTFDESAPRARQLTCEILAYQAAKQRFRESRAGNPRNIVAMLLYNVSHSAERDHDRRAMWEKRLDGGYELGRLSRVDEALGLIRELRGAYLSEELIGRLVGRVVNLGRIAGFVGEEYERLCGGEVDG